MSSQNSQKEVMSYSCRHCDYELHVFDSSKDQSGSKLLKMMNMGSMSVQEIDGSRFYMKPRSGNTTTSVECECDCCACCQYLNSRQTLYEKEKLLCRNCQRRVGTVTYSTTVTRKIVGDADESAITYGTKYEIKRSKVKKVKESQAS